jgi:hypothetical protein
MAVRIDLANAALGHIGEGHLIANLSTDRTPAGIAIKRFYDQTRQSMLAEHDWQFARRTTTMAGYGPAPPTWSYAYLRPAGCAAVRVVLSSGTVIDYGIGGVTDAAGNDVDLILSQNPASHVVWTRDVVNEARWPYAFALAFEWRLAAMICRPLAKDESTRGVCWEQHGQAMVQAQAIDQRQMRQTIPVCFGDYISARQ